MNARERVICALSLEEPDCVPVGELAVIDKKVMGGFGKNYKDVVEFAAGEGLSIIGIYPDFNVVKNADGNFSDDWGCIYGPTKEDFAHPVKGPIATRHDLERYEFPDPDVPYRLNVLPEIIKKAKGEIAVNFHSRVAFMWSVYLMGMDNLLTTMALDRDFAHELFTKVADVNIRIIKRAIRAGADTISLGDDYCSNRGPLMSPEMFREFILPHLERAVSVIRSAGLKCIKHCDGNLWPILDDIVETGIDCINPLEPVANMEISEVKQKYGSRISMMGNIDCGDLLCHGSEDEIDTAVRTCIEAGGRGGGLIVSSSNSIHSGVKPENYAAMIRAVHKYGKYPLNLQPEVQKE